VRPPFQPSRTTRSSYVNYTDAERRILEPVRQEAASQAVAHPERRDVFLCHAWDDRHGSAKELHDLLESLGVTVWFSGKDFVLGTSLIRELERGLTVARTAVVLVTPRLCKSLEAERIADKELSALLATDRVLPVAHGTTFEALRDVSPMLAARSGLSSERSSLRDVATKIADTVGKKEPSWFRRLWRRAVGGLALGSRK
jgi:hypothetical protein